MILQKEGRNYKGYDFKNYTKARATNRLQHAVHFFIDVLNAEKWYKIAELYEHLSIKDKHMFSNLLCEIDDWIREMDVVQRLADEPRDEPTVEDTYNNKNIIEVI